MGFANIATGTSRTRAVCRVLVSPAEGVALSFGTAGSSMKTAIERKRKQGVSRSRSGPSSNG